MSGDMRKEDSRRAPLNRCTRPGIRPRQQRRTWRRCRPLLVDAEWTARAYRETRRWSEFMARGASGFSRIPRPGIA